MPRLLNFIPMYLHFQNWSSAPSIPERLDTLQLPHQNEVVKVFSSPEDPRVELDRPALHVVETDGDAFASAEEYEYLRRRKYTGAELEEELAAYDLSELGRSMVRSLFRFSHEQGFCQAAMAAQRRNLWVIRHPFESVDGIASRGKPVPERALHLDIFLPGSLQKALKLVDYRNPDAVLSWRDSIRWIQAA